MKEQRRSDANLLSDIVKSIGSLRTVVDLMHASLNGVRSMMFDHDNALSAIEKIQLDMHAVRTEVKNMAVNSKLAHNRLEQTDIITIDDEYSGTHNTNGKQLYSKICIYPIITRVRVF